uniref:Si:ch211-221f10.2 n=1 Tax=Neogobius melanostomus TaxID=47308 RepID=A0A8C6TDA5_9GOBI
MFPDALEAAGQVEGLALSSLHPPLESEEEEGESSTEKGPKRRGRYRHSLQLLKPFRITHKHQHPVDNAGLFSFMTLQWLSPLAMKAYRNASLSVDDVWGLSCHESLWHDELKQTGREGASLTRVCWRFCRTRLLVAIFSLLLTMVAGFAGPALLIRALLEYCQSTENDIAFGLSLVAGIFLMELTRSWAVAFTWAVNYRTAARLRGATLTLAFQKILSLRSTKEISPGELINMCSSDGQRLYEAVSVGCLLAGGPLVGILGLSYTAYFLGPTALLGSAIFIIFYPAMMLASRLTAYFRRKCVAVTDRRVRLMNEVLSCIKFIKMYCWEDAFVRSEERSILERAGIVQSLTVGVAPIVVVIASVCTFTLHMALGYDLTAAEAFTVVAVFNSMTFALKVTPLAVRALSEGSVAVKRFQVRIKCTQVNLLMLLLLSTQPSESCTGTGTRGYPMGTRKRSKECPNAQSLLTNMEQESPQSTISSTQRFISWNLWRCWQWKEFPSHQGNVAVSGGFAYVSQQAWILNHSLKENILFGNEFEPQKYNNILEVCCLLPDLAELPYGDMTEIGERGANLSGGQRQRVSLARALYSERPILLLDDPLSAVDACVGSHVFHKAIRGAAKGKTVLFVTHQLQYLPECDDIILMNNGQIAEHGTHAQLMEKDRDYAVLFNSMQQEVTKEVHNFFPSSLQKQFLLSMLFKCYFLVQLMQAEEKGRGGVAWSVYASYIKAAGGPLIFIINILLFLSTTGSIAFSNWWLSYWIRQGSGNTSLLLTNETTANNSMSLNPDIQYYSNVYIMSMGAVVILKTIRGLVYVKCTVKASSKLHDKVFRQILLSPMHFFDTTPLGRILTRFSRDMDEVDVRLAMQTEMLLQNLTLVLFCVGMVGTVFPWFLISILPVGFISSVDQYTKPPASKSQLELETRVLYAYFSWDKRCHFFSFRYQELLDTNQASNYLFSCAMRWLAVRLDLISIFLISAYAGLAISYAVQLTGLFQFTVRLLAETEARFTSVERISHYIKNLDSEAPRQSSQKSAPAPSWPQQGQITFQNVEMCYRHDLPLVLKQLSFNILPHETIGIVGRTGSGKSSLGVALFRLVELTGGSITIDGVNIAQIGLDDLRSKLAIIPQEPVLFIGTVRSNLDPWDQYSDSEIWEALEKTHIREMVNQLPHSLLSEVTENGDNFSVGERQLLCVARALLRNSKILILDEATAAIDTETDRLIQETIRSAFGSCTTLIIAHRLNTVMNCSRVMVLDKGQILEFDKPAFLLADENSRFRAMIEASENQSS